MSDSPAPPSVDFSRLTVGWIGTGVMGRSMAGHLLDAGCRLVVFNRSSEKSRALIERGAEEADTPAEVARRCDIIFVMVGYPRDVRQVVLGEEADSGVLSGLRPGGIVVDMTTSEPALAEEIAERALLVGGRALDAPVSGGDIGARNATLSIMVGGDSETFARVLPLFQRLGKTIVLQGGPGAGQHTKMVNQILVAASMIGVCEALLYAEKAGLDVTTVLQSVSSGAAGSWSLANLGPRIVQGDFAPGFYVEHFIKDMRIALSEAERMRVALPGLALVSQLYNAVAAQGHARSGTQALMIALKTLNGG
jgi:3-hydroxyisobutyrate dehydrogenase